MEVADIINYKYFPKELWLNVTFDKNEYEWTSQIVINLAWELLT
jgi:hypothetical protein